MRNSETTFHGAWGAPPIPPKRPLTLLQLDDTIPTPRRRSRRNLGQILQEFAENTTAHGVPSIARSKRSITKVFWLAVFLIMLGVFCWQGATVLHEYLQYPSTTKVQLITNTGLDFPAVTVCNMNRFRRSKIAGTRFEGLIAVDGGLKGDGETADYSWWFDWDEDWYNKYMATYGDVGKGTGSSGSLSRETPTVTGGTGGASVATEDALNGGDTNTIGDSSFSDTSTTRMTNEDIVTTEALAGVETDLGNGFTGEGTSDGTGDGISDSWTEETWILTDANDPATTGHMTEPSCALPTSDDTTTNIVRATSEHASSLTTLSASDAMTTVPITTAFEPHETDNTQEIASNPALTTYQLATDAQADTPTSAPGSFATTPGGGGSGGSGGLAPQSSGDQTPSMSANDDPPMKTGFEDTTPSSDTGTSRRKKRSLRTIRDTAGDNTEEGSGDTASQSNSIMDVVGEFGSWVQHEWNNGPTSDQTFDFSYERLLDLNNTKDPNDWGAFYRLSKSPDYSDFIDIINPTRQELQDLGHQAEDLIIQCTFDKRSCSYKDFFEFQNKEYGNCFTFNHRKNSSKVRVTKNSGAQFGLHLTMFLEMPEYMGILSPEAGVRVAIHSPNTPPFPEDDGITISPGQATNIGIRQVYIERLGKPHNNECHPFTHETYSRKACNRMCVQGEMFNKCNCVSDILLGNKTKCSYINSTQQKCRQLVEYLGEERRLNCSCPVSCNETSFVKSVSSSLWPSERYEEHLQTRLKEHAETAFAARMASSEDSTSKNLVRLRVYFEELNYQSIVESPSYTFPNLLGNVGGLLGLYIGVSVLTLTEVFTLLFAIIKHLTMRMCSHGKVAHETPD